MSRRELAAQGVSNWQVERELRNGGLVQLRIGWYAMPHADPDVARAVRLGGALSCVSALRWYGVWVPEHEGLHIRLARRPRPGTVTLTPHVHCCSAPFLRRMPVWAAVDSLDQALACAAHCLSPEGLIVVMDSLLNLQLMSQLQIMDALATCSTQVRELVHRCDRSESGTESMTRVRLRSLRFSVRSQVWIEGVGRVDLLVGRRLVLECDSRAHHTGVEHYESDRLRDRRLTALGYIVIRLSYHQVVHQWDEVLADLMVILRRREHLRHPAQARPEPRLAQSA